MHTLFRTALRALHLLIALLLSAHALDAQVLATSATLIKDVRLFDGLRTHEHMDVLLRAGKIVAVGSTSAKSPAPGIAVIDGRGKTLIPGLIDAHTHAFADALREALAFGVTTELDMFTDVRFARAMEREQDSGAVTTRADLYSAGTLVTAPRGHGTEYGFAIPTITSPDSAQAFVDARIAEGSNYIKIIYDDGHAYGLDIPTIDTATMRAVVRAAHARGKMAVVHIGSLAGARAAIAAGADGLAHLFTDTAPDPQFARFVAAHHTPLGPAFIVPTLTVLASGSAYTTDGVRPAAALARDTLITPYLDAASAALLAATFPRGPTAPPLHFEAAEQAVRELKAAKVPLLAGTDASNPGTAHGAALHLELALLTHAGLSPTEALIAATSTPARAFHLTDRGRIAPGYRADVVLVDGDPTQDITRTRAITAIWKDGVAFDRAAYRSQITAARTRVVASVPSNGVLSDFEDGAMVARAGTGWLPSSDAIVGGQSTVEPAVSATGGHASAKALTLHGTIGAKPAVMPVAWAGVLWSPGAQPLAAGDLSPTKALHFWTRGDGKSYQVMVFAKRTGRAPTIQTFVADSAWHEVSIPWTSFGTDGSDIMGIVIAAGPSAGSFSFALDDIRLQ